MSYADQAEQQKRIRALLRQHGQYSSIGHVLWDLQYCRFDRLSANIIQGGATAYPNGNFDATNHQAATPPSTPLFANLTLFLAAFPGAPLPQDSPKSRFGSEISLLLRQWETTLSGASLPVFFEMTTDLTVADSPAIRVTSVQVGAEVALPYLRLLITQLTK